MKTALVLASLVALALAGSINYPTKVDYRLKNVDADFVKKQQYVLDLYYYSGLVNTEAEYYKIGHDYKIEEHVEDYTNKQAVEDFVNLWKVGFFPKYNVPFSIFQEKARKEAVALFRVFYYAKDFDVFYKTACFARVHMNEGMFLYTFYNAVLHRPDLKGIVLPAPYEAYPELFSNTDVWYLINRIKMQHGFDKYNLGNDVEVTHEDNHYVVYANYSDHRVYYDNEDRISYFTEDVGLNAYYYYFHAFLPFWMESEFRPELKEHRGEIYFNFYQQLLARYYLERLSNGLGEIPDFSWDHQIEAGYKPAMNYYENFVQRPKYYQIPYEKHVQELKTIDTFEQSFIQFLQQVHFKAFNQDVDFRNSKSVNFVGNFWQGNADLFTKEGAWNHVYEIVARHVLSGVPDTNGKYDFTPSALGFYQTSLRDPIFYRLYSKIMKYFMLFKKFLTPYSQDALHYVGVKINDVKVDRLVTYFDYYDFDVSNGLYYSNEEMKTNNWPYFYVRQPRLNHKPFTVTVDVKSDVEGEAVFKIFLGPKYDSKGYPINIEDNWQNFVELDWSVQKLTKGQNKIERHSTDFYYTRQDSARVSEIVKFVKEGKVPADMSVKPGAFPQRLVLPRGTGDGFPYQFFVVVYPYQAPAKKVEGVKVFANDNKPLGFPLDRPVNEVYFKQPNMFFEDVKVYHEGEMYSYQYNVPTPVHHNEVNEH